MIAQAGDTSLHIIDPDDVEEANFGPQGYSPLQLGQAKAVVACSECRDLNRNCFTTGTVGYFPSATPSDFHPTFVLCCADVMEVRKTAADFARDHGAHFIDCRMGAETLLIYTLPSLKPAYHLSYSHPSISFPQSEAEELPCAARSTPHCSSLAASFAFHAITRLLRSGHHPFRLTLHLPSFSLFADEPDQIPSLESTPCPPTSPLISASPTVGPAVPS